MCHTSGKVCEMHLAFCYCRPGSRHHLIVYGDVESTGLSTKDDSIVEIAAVIDSFAVWRGLLSGKRNGLDREYSTLVRPTKHDMIPASATAIHHITTEDVTAEHVPRFAAAWQALVAWLESWRQVHFETESSIAKIHGESDVPIALPIVVFCTHNGFAFDQPLIANELSRCGLVAPEWLVWGDSLVILRDQYSACRIKSFALQKLWNVWCRNADGSEQSHRALDDARKLRDLICCALPKSRPVGVGGSTPKAHQSYESFRNEYVTFMTQLVNFVVPNHRRCTFIDSDGMMMPEPPPQP